MTVEEYDEFLVSLGLGHLIKQVTQIRPESLDIKARLVSKYHGEFTFGHHDEVVNMLVLYTPKTNIVFIFDCPSIDAIHISWASNGSVARKICGFDDILVECDKIIEEI